MKTKYVVSVGKVGKVYEGNSGEEAMRIYKEQLEKSETDIFLTSNDEIYYCRMK